MTSFQIFRTIDVIFVYCLPFTQIAISILVNWLFVYLFQFGLDWDVYLTKLDQTYKVMKVKELLPFTFVPDDLKK